MWEVDIQLRVSRTQRRVRDLMKRLFIEKHGVTEDDVRQVDMRHKFVSGYIENAVAANGMKYKTFSLTTFDDLIQR